MNKARATLFLFAAVLWPTGSHAQSRERESIEPAEALVFDVAVQGGFAYLSQGPCLTVVEVSDPASPKVVSRLGLRGMVASDSSSAWRAPRAGRGR